MNKPTDELLLAINHVKEYFPSVSIVIFDKEGRWQYMDDNFRGFVFDERIESQILQDASDSIEVLPYIYQIPDASLKED